VDDLLIFGSNLSIVCETKNLLCNSFEMKDLGKGNVILGMKITRKNNGIFLDQAHYVDKILKKYSYENSNAVSTPFTPNVHLEPTQDDNFIGNQKEHTSLIGSLRYLSDCTRLDIAYVVSLLGRFTSKPNITH